MYYVRTFNYNTSIVVVTSNTITTSNLTGELATVPFTVAIISLAFFKSFAIVFSCCAVPTEYVVELSSRLISSRAIRVSSPKRKLASIAVAFSTPVKLMILNVKELILTS